MMLLATFCPFIFAELGQVLLVSLLIGFIISFFLSSTWLDWIFVIIFSLYVGYDWVMAQEDEPTFGNAVKHAANLYLDIVNLFLKLLSIKGKDD
jgi:FtsH-binding integral membrane protein